MTAVRRTALRWLTVDLYRKISACFAALIIYQWIRCLGDYWWTETFTIINGVLLVAVAAHLLLPRKRYSIPVQLIGLVAVNMHYSKYRWFPFEGSRRVAADWYDWAYALLDPLYPYIWISLGVWAAFHVIVFARRKRAYMIVLVGLATLSLTIADSVFTPIYLWQEIAWLVFIGLAWLVASHFANFRARHPENWARLLEYPLGLFVPILFIITLVMVAGLFVPTIKPVLTDPYTAWKESRGESVPSYVGDKAVTIAANKSKADTHSGYGRNDSVLGGGFAFDYTPVMTVTTDQRSYWRGETRALYNGKGWTESAFEKAEEPIKGIAAGAALPAQGMPEATKTRTVGQSVTMVRTDKFPVLFGAGPITSVVSLDDNEGAFPSLSWLQTSWELRLSKSNLHYPKSYEIQSNVPVLDENALRSGTAAAPAEELNPVYLQLPDELPARVKELAAELTKDAKTPYDKVRMIVGYLQANYKYTNTPDLSKKKSDDFVDAFLFEMGEGYCDYFSTSLAVMTRSIGIPARWVKGYSSGSMPQNPQEQQLQGIPGAVSNPDGAGTYTVRNADAHSWVEVYFEGYGWLPFESTPGFTYPYAKPKDEPAQVTQEDNVPDTAPVVAPVVEDSGFRVRAWMVWTPAAALALALAVYAYRTVPGFVRRRRGGPDTVNARIVHETNRLIKHCRKKGLDYDDSETVRETMGRWSTRLTMLRPQFEIVQYAFEKAMYSGQTMTQGEADRVTETAKQIREHIG